MQKLFFTCLISLFGVACSSSNTFDGEYINCTRPRSIKLTSLPILCDIPGAVDGFVVDSLYVFYTMLHPEHRFVICSLPSMTPVAEFVRVGRGPNEYTYLQCEGRISDDKLGRGVWFFSGIKHEAARLNLTKSLEKGSLHIDDRLVLDERVILEQVGMLGGQLFGFDRVDDSTAIFQAIQGMQIVKGVYNIRNQSVISRLDFDEQSSREPNLTGGPVELRPDRTKVALLPVFFDQINICEIDGTNRRSFSTRSKPFSLSQIENTDRSQRWQYYSDIEVTSDRIIVLYSNKETKGRELHLFDWDGNLLHVLVLDDQVSRISLDIATSVLYGYVSSEKVCKMELRPWL